MTAAASSVVAVEKWGRAAGPRVTQARRDGSWGHAGPRWGAVVLFHTDRSRAKSEATVFHAPTANACAVETSRHTHDY
jgi:hypothetical protein